MDARQGSTGDEVIAKALRGAVDDAQFDYSALVAGTHQRAGRIRRRRAIVTGAAAAVLAPALIGGAALVLPDLLPGSDVTVIAPAGPSDDATATSAPVDEADVTAAPDAPPWQDSEPPLPEGGFEVNEDLPNAWDIPDARPSGVEELDAFGVPQAAWNYPREVPVMGLMVCDPGRDGGVEPEAAQSFSFFTDTGEDLTIDIQVTGWADGTAALEGLRTDSYTLCRWAGDPGEPQLWGGHEGEDDHLLLTPEGEGRSAAVVRQGDYLVAVTVSEGTALQNADVATEIADKTADNLEALDPTHGRD